MAIHALPLHISKESMLCTSSTPALQRPARTMDLLRTMVYGGDIHGLGHVSKPLHLLSVVSKPNLPGWRHCRPVGRYPCDHPTDSGGNKRVQTFTDMARPSHKTLQNAMNCLYTKPCLRQKIEEILRDHESPSQISELDDIDVEADHLQYRIIQHANRCRSSNHFPISWLSR
jgi:hypothetical protein